MATVATRTFEKSINCLFCFVPPWGLSQSPKYVSPPPNAHPCPRAPDHAAGEGWHAFLIFYLLHRTAPALVFLRLPPTTPRHARSRALRLDGRATAGSAAPQRTLILPNHVSEPSRPKGAPLPLQPRSSPPHAHPLARSSSQCSPHRWLLQPDEEHGRPWARMARSLPHPLHRIRLGSHTAGVCVQPKG